MAESNGEITRPPAFLMILASPFFRQDKRYEELLSAMNRLTGAIQAGNILNSNNKEVKEPSAEDILAEVLSPSKGGIK